MIRLRRQFSAGRVTTFPARNVLGPDVLGWDIDRLVEEEPDASIAKQPNIAGLGEALAARGLPEPPRAIRLEELRDNIRAELADPCSVFGDHPFDERLMSGEDARAHEACFVRSVSRPVDGRTCITRLGTRLTGELGLPEALAAWRAMVVMVWIGASSPYPGGPLHADGLDNVLYQIRGTKRLIVYPPRAIRRFPLNPMWSRFLCFQPVPDARVGPWHARCRERFPRLSDIPYQEIVMRPGDAVAIPTGALHAAYGSLDSLSLSTFLIPGPLPHDRRTFFRACLQMGVVYPLRRALKLPIGSSEYRVQRIPLRI